MPMTNPNDDLAPYADALSTITQVSRDAYKLYTHLSPNRSEKYDDLVKQSVSIAHSITSAITSLLDQNLHIAAIALTRVRLEHVIVFSYLVHEKPEEGFGPYSRYAPIQEYRTMRAVLADEFLAPHIPAPVDLEALNTGALDAQLGIDPGFDITKGKYQPKWTSLDLPSMAQRRDKLAASVGWIYSKAVPLTSLYTAFYRIASSPVHGDASMLGTPFWGPLKGLDGVERDSASFWRLLIPSNLAAYDSLQCYEALRWLGVVCDTQFAALTRQLIEDRGA